jgi:phosphatidate cytidylyltransferase
VLAGLEWARLCRLTSASAWIFAVSVALVFLISAYTRLDHALFVLAAVLWIVVAPLWMWRGMRAEQVTWIGAAGFAVLVPAGLAMLALGPLHVLLVLVLVWIADTVAYFVGRACGLLGALAYAIICRFFIEGIAWAPYLAAAALLAMVSIVGDLFESAAKRQAGVKDSGTTLPGHGGILDRIDSATAVLPVAALLWPWIQ